MKMPIIGLGGQAGVGKDTVAKYIKNNSDRVKLIAFAEPIKSLLKRTGQLDDEQLYGSKKEEPCYFNVREFDWTMGAWAHGICEDFDLTCSNVDYMRQLKDVCQKLQETGTTPRSVMQIVGTEFFRSLDKDIWTKYAIKTAKNALKDGEADMVVLTDCRFRNEIVAIKECGGSVFLITSTAATQNVPQHASETVLNGIPNYWFDKTFVNLKTSVQNAEGIATDIWAQAYDRK